MKIAGCLAIKTASPRNIYYQNEMDFTRYLAIESSYIDWKNEIYFTRYLVMETTRSRQI